MISVYRLGRVEYEDGLRLLDLFGEARQKDLIGDVLLLLEHSPVITLGRTGKRGNILLPPDELERLGIQVIETNRGGDVTYHGPGQVVGYPIFKLPPGRQDVRRYVRDVEEAIIRTLARYGINAGRIPKLAGVWLGEESSPQARKIAAIGIHIARWQTSHGFALNVSTALSCFGFIVPCGLQGKGVTSIAAEVGRPVPMRDVEDELARHFGELFGAPVRHLRVERRTVSVVVTRGRDEVLLLKRTPARGGFWQVVTGRVEEGESVLAAASREVQEETGRALLVAPLDYVHSFALGDESPPQLIEESAFVARWPSDAPIVLDPREHTECEWVPLAQALQRLPFAGFKVAVRRAVGEGALLAG